MRGKLHWERQDKLIFSAKLHSGNLIAFCSSIFSDMTLTWHVNMLQCSIMLNVGSIFFFHLGLHICIGYFFSQQNNFHIFNVLWKNQYLSSQRRQNFSTSIGADCKELLNTHRWPLTPKVKVCRSNVELFKKYQKSVSAK